MEKELKVTNPRLEFLCVLQENTGEIFLHQFNQPRCASLQNYFWEWAISKTKGDGTPLAGRFTTCIKTYENGAWCVVEEGFFKLVNCE